jgi:large exoprotein involved in heme utilization and adhesion
MEKDSEINSSTSGSGNAGQIEITVDSVSLSNSSISTAVNLGAVGQGGAIEIESQSLSLTNQSTLEARSRGEGNAGSIQVNIGDAVTLSNQSQITVSKEGTQGEAGDIEVSAYSLSLDSGSKIIAETDSGEGGDISLLVQDLLVLRDGSRISTEAGTAQAGGDGGNIKIDAQFILAVPEENSDIIANAFEGRGGTINITTQGIFGIEFRANLTPLSDITASSTLGVDGEVEINRPDVDPSRGLAELPTDFVNAQGLIDRSCTPGGSAAQNSSFTVTGRGGLPSNPTDPLSDDTVWSDLRTFTPQAENLLSSATDVDPNQSSTKQIVEAQGWIVNPNGNVILTAKAHSATQQSPWLMSPTCQDVRAVTD